MASPGELRSYGCATSHFVDQIFQCFAQRFLLQRLRAKRLHRAARLTQTLAGEVPGSIKMAGGFHCLILGRGLLNCFQLNDHAGESLRERVVNVASHPIALGHHGRLTTLSGKTGQLHCQRRLMGESTGQFDLLLAETTVHSKPDADKSSDTSGDEHWHKQNSVDAHLPQMRLETHKGGSQLTVLQDVVPGCTGVHSDTHPDNRLINVFEDGVKTSVQNFPPQRMILRQHCEPCCRMESATTSLKAAILDHGEEFQPITIRFSIPHADTMRVRLLDDRAQHMFQQSVRVRFLRQRIERVSESLQLATCQKFRRAQRFGGLLPFNGDGRKVRYLFNGVLMLRSWAAWFTPVDSEDSQYAAV